MLYEHYDIMQSVFDWTEFLLLYIHKSCHESHDFVHYNEIILIVTKNEEIFPITK